MTVLLTKNVGNGIINKKTIVGGKAICILHFLIKKVKR